MEEPQGIVAERIVRELLGSPISSHANVNVNAGGMGVWVSSTCCIVMLACNIFLAVLLMDHSRQLSDLRDYLNVIYRVAPHLKPDQGLEKSP
jgi:hypothetical protein